MSTGCMVQELNKNKLELSGIVGNSTYIDVIVVKPSGKKKIIFSNSGSPNCNGGTLRCPPVIICLI